MSTGAVAICNSALIRIGAARISSLDSDTPGAKLCKEQYPKVLSDLLRGHPWKFARQRAVLAMDADAPAWGYAYSYQLPANCLRVIEMEGQESYAWSVEGRALVTDQDAANILYIRSDVKPGEFDSCFAEALASKLAHVLSFSLVQSITLRQDLEKEAKEKLREARSFNGQEGAGDRVYADSWLNSRA